MSYAKIVLGRRGFKQARAPLPVSAAVARDGASVTVEFDHLISATSPAQGWVVYADGGPASVTGVSITGTTLTISLDPALLEGAVVTLDYAAGTVIAIDGGVSLGDFAAPMAVTNNSTINPPTLVATPTVDTTGRYVTATFDMGLTATSPSLGWAVAGSTIDAVEIAATTVTLHLTAPVLQGASVTLAYDYVTGTLASVDDVPVQTFSVAATNNSTVVVPQVSGTPAVATSGASISVVWDRAIDSLTPTAGWTLLADGLPVDVATGGIAGSTLTLTPAEIIVAGATVSLEYAGGTLAAVYGGVAAANYGPAAITNNSTQTNPSVSGTPAINSAGTTLTVTMSEAVTATAVASGWLLTVGGVAVPMTGVIAGSTITFTLGSVTESGLSAALSYTGGDLVAADNALPAAVYGPTAITNNSTITRPTISGTPAVGSTGMTTSITLSQAATGVTSSGWTLRADSAVVPISGYSVAGNVLTLEHALILSSSYVTEVTLQYAAPPGAIAGSTGGLAMVSVAEAAITNNSVRVLPTYTSGYVGADGASIVATFSEALNAAMNPLLGFTFDVVPGTGAPYVVTPDAASYSAANQITFTFSEVIYAGGAEAADVVRMDYDDTTGEIEADSGGADTLTFVDAVVVNTSARVRPYITAAAMQPGGFDVVLTFNENLNTAVSATAGFQYKLNGTNVSLAGSGSGFGPAANQITHRLASVVYMHTGDDPQVLTVDYTPGAIVDVSSGDSMLALVAGAIENQSTQVPLVVSSAAATDDGHTVRVTLSAPLDTGTSAAGFAVTLDGAPIAVSPAFGPAANQISLTLATPLFVGDTVVLLGYTPGTLASDVGSPLLATADVSVDVSAVTRTWNPGEIPQIIDYFIWSDLSRLKANASGSGAVTSVGQQIRYWRGQMDVVTLTAANTSDYARLAADRIMFAVGDGTVRGRLRGAAPAGTTAYNAPKAVAMAASRTGNVGAHAGWTSDFSGGFSPQQLGLTMTSDNVALTYCRAKYASWNIPVGQPEDISWGMASFDGGNITFRDWTGDDTTEYSSEYVGTSTAASTYLSVVAFNSTYTAGVRALAYFSAPISLADAARLDIWLAAQAA